MTLTRVKRTAACLFIFMLGTAIYIDAIKIYTENLQKPLILEMSFVGTLMLVLLQYIWSPTQKFRLENATVTVLYFLIGVGFAYFIRLYYMELVSDMLSVPEMQDIVGSDYYSALTNKAIGYGGSFGVGLALARLTTHHWLNILIFKLSQGLHPDALKCPHCNN